VFLFLKFSIIDFPFGANRHKQVFSLHTIMLFYHTLILYDFEIKNNNQKNEFHKKNNVFLFKINTPVPNFL